MTTQRSSRGPLRKVLPWVMVALAVQGALRVGGRLLARRLDSGDETSTEIRRVRTFDQLKLAPVSGELSRIQLDLTFAGVELDLTGARPKPGGADLTMHCAFAGGDVRVPANWRVFWDVKGPVGVNIKRGEPIEKAAEAGTADLRVHVRGWLGGAGLKT